MNYQYSVSPYIQAAMAQAMQAIMSGGPLPPNCFVVAIPFQQVQQMLPQLMMANYSGGGMMYPQPSSYYGQYQPQIAPYMDNQQANALVPYSNYYHQGYQQNYNYPMVPYGDYNSKSKKKRRYGKPDPSQPHSNVYNSSSFDSHMEDLSWSRLFGHSRRQSKQKDQAALSYDQKSSSSKKRRVHSADSFTSSTTSSTTTTSDETIRRVNVSLKQPSGSSSLKQQTKGSLPFKYSSEFIPGGAKPKSNKKESKVKSDDIFVVKKPEPPTTTQPSSSKQ